MQSLASHKKMYKAGKIWLAATITTVFIGAGIMVQEQGVSADMNTVPAVAQVGSNNDFSQKVKDQQGMVDYAQMHVDMAQKEVDAAQAKFNDVDKTAKVASPQKIAEIQGQVKEAQGQLEDTQSKVDTLKKQADGYEAIMEDRDKAQEEYEHANDQVSVIELDLEKATQDYHNAATPEEQNEAFIQVANLSRAFVIASKDRDAKKAIADAKAEGFEEAFLRYRVVTNELDQLEPVLNKKTYALEELKNRLNQYQNINQDRQSALSDLKEKEQELQRCKNYLLEQKNKLSKIMSQAQNNQQEQTSVTGKSEETNAKREPKKDKTEGVKENTSITNKNNNVNSQPKDDEVLSHKVTGGEASQSMKEPVITAKLEKTKENYNKKDIKDDKDAALVNLSVHENLEKENSVLIKNGDSSDTLPQAGNKSSVTFTALGIMMTMFGFSFIGYKKKH